MLSRLQALSDDHFNCTQRGHLGPCRQPWHYAELLRRITDVAFNEGEHA